MVSSKHLHEAHVAIFTFPFTSHPLIFWNLACKLASADPQVHFSFFNTAKSNSFILSIQKTDLPINIRPYNVEDGIPECFDISELIQNPFKEYGLFIEGLPGNFKKAMDEAVKETGRSITCFLTDVVLSFYVGMMAEELNARWISFWLPAPYALPAYIKMELISQLYSKAQAESDRPGEQIVDLIPGLPPIRFSDFPEETKKVGASENSPSLSLSMMKKLQQTSALVLNSYDEINPTLLTSYFKSKFKNILYVGSLTRSVLSSDSGADATGCLSWLDGKKVSSVAYISFGTTVNMSDKEMVALTEALEDSDVPFLWSLKDNIKKQLPNGFVERMSKLGNGKIFPWAPQSRVLEHPSIGVHITHCGYNGVIDSILGGVPMICKSVCADNYMTAKMVEEVWGIGVRVEGGVITKSGMLNNLETIFHHDKGKKIREAIASFKEVLTKAAGPNGSAAKDFRTLLQMITIEK